MEHLHPDDVLLFAKNGQQVILGEKTDILSALYDLPERFSFVSGVVKSDADFFNLEAILNVTLPQAHAYISLPNFHSFFSVEGVFAAQGWKAFPSPLIWDRKGPGHPSGDFFPSYRCSLFLFAVRGDKPLRVSCSDILRYGPEASQWNMESPPPPIPFWEDLLARSSLPGDKLLDFSGELNLLTAANRSSRKLTCLVNSIEKFNTFSEYLK